jgi:hypothetical protein
MGKCVRFVIEVYRFDNFLKVIKFIDLPGFKNMERVAADKFWRLIN